MKTLIERLRDLADEHRIGDEAADEIERLARPVTFPSEPVCWIRMRNGKPDWAEDCVSEDRLSLASGCPSRIASGDVYEVIPLYAAPPTERTATNYAMDLTQQLADLYEYFEQRQDASMEPGDDRFRGNEEMHRLQDVQDVEDEVARLRRCLSEAQSRVEALEAEKCDAVTWVMLKQQLDKWRDLAQKLVGVDANDHGWLRAELDSQWTKRDAYAGELAALLRRARGFVVMQPGMGARLLADIDGALSARPQMSSEEQSPTIKEKT